ncbi:hypothetical protein ACQEU6_38975 [Spirillospora sp. CA-108201]
MNRFRLDSFTKRPLKAPNWLRQIGTTTRRLLSAHRRRLISVAIGAVVGAVIGGLIESLDYSVYLADLWNHGVDPFEFGDFGYMGTKAAVGAITGAIGAICVGFGNAFTKGGDARTRMIFARVACVAVVVAIVACFAFVALAAFGVTAVSITGPIGGSFLDRYPGSLLITACGYAAGVVVGELRADN